MHLVVRRMLAAVASILCRLIGRHLHAFTTDPVKPSRSVTPNIIYLHLSFSLSLSLSL